MRTFEFKDGKSNKFWNIDLSGKSFTVTFGRIGTPGQSQEKTFPTEAGAKAAHDKLVAEKTGKGYVESTAGAAAAPSGSTSGKALENAIFANPDDLGAHAAYADWLIEQGDPRGEFIQVQLALEDPKKPAAERKKLQKREQELLKTHQKAWLGDLTDFFLGDEKKAGTAAFARGWLDTVSIGNLTVALSRVLAAARLARVVRRLEIAGIAYEEAGEYEAADDIPEDEAIQPSVYPLVRSNNFSNVRVFQLGDLAGAEQPNCHVSGETAVDLVKKMPRIEELYLLAHGVDTKALFGLKTLQNLRILQVYHVTGEYALSVLAKNPALGNLTHLLCWPHGLEPDDDQAYIRLSGVKALVHSPHLKSLTHLRLRLNDMGDKGCQEIVASGILKRLKVLDLHGGCITDQGAKVLAGCADLHNLELLIVSGNRLTKDGIAALKKASRKLEAGSQYGEHSDEHEYLWEGDAE
jgi:uncharacterized protein (TIGR02996 family)